MGRDRLCFGALVAALTLCSDVAGGDRDQEIQHPTATTVSGVVVGSDGPRADAIVRVQTKNHFTTTDPSGRFELDVAALGTGPLDLTAWARGYFCTGPVRARAGDSAVRIELLPHHAGDNPEYRWRSAEHRIGSSEHPGCAACHSRGDDLPYTLPVDDWRLDAHGSSARNPRFLSMYLGTDLSGRKSPLTRTFPSRDYGTVPLPPDTLSPYFGPGYKLDFPDTAGNCAACHVPVAAVTGSGEADPTAAAGVAAEGITCDFCHKVSQVIVDPATGLPYPDRPGVLSFGFQRPPEGQEFFTGPFDDVAPSNDTYSPLQSESLYCAPCHFSTFWGTEIYGSFREWLESPYSDPRTGKTCQDCHMPPTGAEYFTRPDQGGRHRPHISIPGHRMPGAADRELLQNAVSMHLQARRDGRRIEVTVDILNDRTGHHVPTDSPLRHLILVITATSQDGRAPEQIAGPTLPGWTGTGDPSEGNYSGLPGKAFAKILREEWTHMEPTAAYWNPTRIVSDTRIPAFGGDTTVVVFEDDQRQPITIEAKLLFRRAFRDLARQKGWTDPDIVMETGSVVVSPASD